jgi:MFS family permease
MSTYLFLYKKLWINWIRKLFRKKVTLIYTLLMAAYFIWVAFMLHDLVEGGGFGTNENMARILCAFTLYLTPLNYASYAKQKGLIFLPSDVHYLFCAPFSPKLNLLYAYGKTILAAVIGSVLIFFAGIFWFHISIWQMVLYVIVCTLLDAAMQGAIVVLLYGTERLSETGKKMFGKLMYLMIGCFVVLAFYILYTEGFSWGALMSFFDGAWIGMIPLIGWSISAMRLIILGPTMVNVICTCLYLLSVLIFVVLAWKMNCTGQYYEDATKFADDYQEARKKSQRGEVAFVGRKKKYKKATIEYKGSGARAIFYRQLLEYKKEKFFIFGFVTLLYLGIGIGLGYLGYRGNLLAGNSMSYYVIPGIMAYMSFIFSGYKSRWGRELENPYVFLIPEPAFSKMWYATLMDHIRSAVHGLLLSLPAVIGMKLEIWYLPVYVFMFVCMNAASLYSQTVCGVIFGISMGDNLKRSLQMILYMLLLTIAIPAAVVAVLVTGSTAVGLLTMAVYLAVLAGLLAWAGSFCFRKMES